MKIEYVPKNWYDTQYNWVEEKASDSLAKTVFEEERKPEFSGLYNSNGEKLFKLTKKDRIGFW